MFPLGFHFTFLNLLIYVYNITQEIFEKYRHTQIFKNTIYYIEQQIFTGLFYDTGRDFVFTVEDDYKYFIAINYNKTLRKVHHCYL